MRDFLERSDPKDSDSWLGLIHDEVSIWEMNLKGHCHLREALLFQRKPPKLEDACGIFPNHIEGIEQRELKVLTSTCDGASLHCKFYCLHSALQVHQKGQLLLKLKMCMTGKQGPLTSFVILCI